MPRIWFLLQWGRDLSIAEMWPSSAMARAGSCFNGAGVPQGGVAEIYIVPKALNVVFQLQWGRDLSIAEITC